MQKIIDIHASLYEATGGKTQKMKIVFYFQQWVHKKEEQTTKQLEVITSVYNERIAQLNAVENTRTLGAHLNPALEQKGQFSAMRKVT